MYSFKIYRTYGCSSFGRCLPRMYKALGLILSSVYKPNRVIQHHYSASGKLQHENQMFKLIRGIVSLRLTNATWDYVFKRWMKGFIWQRMLIIPTLKTTEMGGSRIHARLNYIGRPRFIKQQISELHEMYNISQ